MAKVHSVFSQMPTILRGLTRGMDPSVLDTGVGEHSGVRVSYAPAGSALGVVLPSNSPGVNSLWMPAIALKTPVVLKPGREEPWTPLRIIRAFLAAGMPREAFGFYPTDHEGAATILDVCDRALLFGDASTTAPWAGDPAVEIHGPGRSKVVLGPDAMRRWRDWLPVLVASVLDNGGRSCINASAVRVPSAADDVADALARELAGVEPAAFADAGARLAACANPRVAEAIDRAIDAALAAGGAEDVTARYRKGGRRRSAFGAEFLLPTVVRCDSLDHPLANTEYLFPFTSVTQVPEQDLVATLGPSLVVTALTREPALLAELSRAVSIQRLNVGPIPTSRVEWDQPHEGNLFEFLWTRRAFQQDPSW
jgi:acyl-CoA reductase-like NAD-dependent aldehyde dehydrogenase